MKHILDPTIQRPEQRIRYAERPGDLYGLRIGLVDSTKKNADAVLRHISDRLVAAYGMRHGPVVRKGQRAPLEAAQIDQLKGRVDLVIVGVGD